MSDDFGKSVRFPQGEPHSEQDSLELFPEHAHLGNEKYNRLLNDYFACVTRYLNPYYGSEILEQQLNRRDLDTVCAYELY